MSSTEPVFIYDKRLIGPRQPNLVYIPLEMDILDKPDLSILCSDIILYDKSGTVGHS